MNLPVSGYLKGGGSKEATLPVVLQMQKCRNFPRAAVECKVPMAS